MPQAYLATHVFLVISHVRIEDDGHFTLKRHPSRPFNKAWRNSQILKYDDVLYLKLPFAVA